MKFFYIFVFKLLDMMTKDIMQCTSDMRVIAETGKYSLEAQVRAFDLLEKILDFIEGCQESPADTCCDSLAIGVSARESAEEYCRTYGQLADVLEQSYDDNVLKLAAEDFLGSFKNTESAAAAKADFAERVHECAKETFEIWQRGGYFARQKALRRLRSLAGFRLESSRIGNYVAKTFDLMNEARMAYANAQQAVFSANASYKLRPGVYADIYKCMNKIKR